MHDVNHSISVLLPVFMRQHTAEDIRLLRRALESIKDQKLAVPHEILLVDDGSPQPVSDCAAQLGAAAQDVTWVRIQHNAGLVNALNTGLHQARHAWIARLDADDRWCDGKMDKQLALLAADPELSIVATGMARVKADGSPIDTHIRPGDWNGILRFYVEEGCPFPHGSVVGRTEVYRLLGGYPHDGSVSHCEDYTLWGTWLRFFKPAMVEEALYDYTVSETSVSSVHGHQQARAAQVARERFARGNLAGRLPLALQRLAQALDVPLATAGRVAYLIWRFARNVELPQAALEPLQVVLFDRVFATAADPAAATTVLPWWRLLGPQAVAPIDAEGVPRVRGRFMAV